MSPSIRGNQGRALRHPLCLDLLLKRGLWVLLGHAGALLLLVVHLRNLVVELVGSVLCDLACHHIVVLLLLLLAVQGRGLQDHHELVPFVLGELLQVATPKLVTLSKPIAYLFV